MSDWHEPLLPPNQTPLEAAIARATGAKLNQLSAAIRQLRHLNDPLQAPLDFLPWLAWEQHVDEWQSDWSEQQQRQTVAASRWVHRYKGTIGAIEQSLAALGLSTSISEWWQQSPRASPYTFRVKVTITETGITVSELGRLFRVIRSSKNARSQLTGLHIEVKTEAPLYAASWVQIGRFINLDYAGPVEKPISERTTSDGASRITSDGAVRIIE